MSGNLIKLKSLAEEISSEVKTLVKQADSHIKMVCVIVGSDPSSLSYMKGIQKRANKLGLELDILELERDINEHDFYDRIVKLNKMNEYVGIIIQMPLPPHIDKYKLSRLLDYKKDIDGITPYNQGRLFAGRPFLIPATAWAVDLALGYVSDEFDYVLQGKTAVVIGRSLTVGRPVFHLLLERNMTPTVVHTKTIDIKDEIKRHDIVVACCGVPEYVTKDIIKEDSLIIDVGIHCVDDESCDTRLCGDVKADAVLDKALGVTAVPGGIGVVTSALLFANLVKCWYKINRNEEVIFEFERKYKV